MTKHPLKKYRILEKGEIVQEGDETDRSADPWKDPAKWEPVLPSEIGELAPDPHYPSHRTFRRSVVIDPAEALRDLYESGSKGFTTCNSSPEEYSVTAKFKTLAEAQAFYSALNRCWILVRDSAPKTCCEDETRNMNGGCDSCGDPCL